MLVRVLDGIRAEGKATKFESLYANGSENTEYIWQARSRAFIHLYLKVMFGIADFTEREAYVTDGGRDGGIDGYFIDLDERIIILIQSKFRTTKDNFESKPIRLDEILSMQVRRVLSGEETDDDGELYNGKINGLQRRVSEIPDLGRYSYKIVIIANVEGVSDQSLRRLCDGYDPEVFNFQRSYNELLYPVVSGTLFKASGLSVALDLSNKSTGAKIGYTVATDDYECEITVVFVPTIEIARIMSVYKNSILLYNPRSYLEFEGETVNTAIKETILSSRANEFAILNNGITIVCDESAVNEQSGRKHRAQLFLLNPQIINGGQTAYTLSIIYDSLNKEERERVFAGKEVLVKTIALTKNNDVADDETKRIALIERISTATNSQTTVTTADRASGDPLHSQIQRSLFERFGLLYERKRGEFSDGLRNGYISKDDLVSRTTFARLYLAAAGKLRPALQKRIRLATLGPDVGTTPSNLERFMVARYAFEHLQGGRTNVNRKGYGVILPKVFAATVVAQNLEIEDIKSRGWKAANIVQGEWMDFLRFAAANQADFIRTIIDPETGEQQPELRVSRNAFFGVGFQESVEQFFGIKPLTSSGSIISLN